MSTREPYPAADTYVPALGDRTEELTVTAAGAPVYALNGDGIGVNGAAGQVPRFAQAILPSWAARPSAPVDGELVSVMASSILAVLGATAVDDALWQLQWRAASSAWLFAGGAPLTATAAYEATTVVGLNTWFLQDPSLEVLGSGWFRCRFGARTWLGNGSPNGWLEGRIGRLPNQSTPIAWGSLSWAVEERAQWGRQSPSMIDTLYAESGDALAFGYQQLGGTVPFHLWDRWLEIVPYGLTI